MFSCHQVMISRQIGIILRSPTECLVLNLYPLTDTQFHVEIHKPVEMPSTHRARLDYGTTLRPRAIIAHLQKGHILGIVYKNISMFKKVLNVTIEFKCSIFPLTFFYLANVLSLNLAARVDPDCSLHKRKNGRIFHLHKSPSLPKAVLFLDFHSWGQ